MFNIGIKILINSAREEALAIQSLLKTNIFGTKRDTSKDSAPCLLVFKALSNKLDFFHFTDTSKDEDLNLTGRIAFPYEFH